MSEFMNALLRGASSGAGAPSETTIEAFRSLSPYSRDHEWSSLTDEDQRTAVAEGIAPSSESIGGKADGGAGSERIDTSETDMNAFLRDAVFESRGRGA